MSCDTVLGKEVSQETPLSYCFPEVMRAHRRGRPDRKVPPKRTAITATTTVTTTHP